MSGIYQVYTKHLETAESLKLQYSEQHFKDVCAMLVSRQLLSPLHWHSMLQIEWYYPSD